MAKRKIYDADEKLLTGDNHPQIIIKGKVVVVDDRESTYLEIMKLMDGEIKPSNEGDTANVAALRLALGDTCVDDLLTSGEMTLLNIQHLVRFVMAAITGKEYEDMEKAAEDAEKN